jgi:hypothetical protein
VLSTDGNAWIDAGRNYLFPVRALSKVFRGKYTAALEQLLRQSRLDVPPQLSDPTAQRRLLRRLRRQAWVVYSKRPFAGPQKLLDYLGRYTHRVAISNHRLRSLKSGQVEFSYRDRRDGDRRKTTSLAAEHLIDRFLKHTLPPGFMRIRHYGLLANRHKQRMLARCREIMGAAIPDETNTKTLDQWWLLWTGEEINKCPCCGYQPLLSEEFGPINDPQPTRFRATEFW